MSAGIDADKAPGPRHLVAALCGLVVGAAVLVPVWRPASLPGWLLIVAASIVAGVVATVLVTWLLHLPARPWFSYRRRLVLLPVATAVVTLLLVGAAAAVLPPGGQRTFCSHPTELRILTAASRLAVTTELALQFQVSTTDDVGCPRVNPYVYAAASDEEAAEALVGGWTGPARASIGPRPDVWLPELPESADRAALAVRQAESNLRAIDHQVVGFTPLVLAVAGQPPEELGGHRTGLTWQELMTRAREGGVDLVRPAPEASQVGRLVVNALYRDGTDLDSRDFEVDLSRGMQEHGYPLTDVDALLCRHRQRAADSAAGIVGLLVTEQAVVAYHRGELPTVTCVGPQPADRSLDAFYATDALTVDYAIADLDWRQAYPRQEAEAGAFRTWLSDSEGQPALAAVHLRIPGQSASEQLIGAPGTLPGAAPDDPQGLPADEAERAEQTYTDARQHGRVLLALDVSGSMREEVSPDLTRYQVARAGIEAALGQLGDDDEFGLWVFPDEANRSDLRVIKDLGSEGLSEEDLAELDGLRPDGPTPLYQTMLDGIQEVRADEGDPERVRAVVVLTDGRDSRQSQGTIDELTEAADTDRVRVFLVAIGEASCQAEVVAEVTQLSGGECVHASYNELDQQLTDLFGRLWSGGADGD